MDLFTLDRTAVLAQLNDLPATFKRADATYDMLVASFATALSRHTHASDALLSQANFADAQGNWLDVWGLMAALPRHDSEEDSAYATRISATLLTSAGPPLVIEGFVELSRGVSATVVENLTTATGWSLEYTTALSSATIAEIAQDLARVRPAGVPFSISSQKGGLYLDTVNYFDRAAVTGAYLTSAQSSELLSISAITNSVTTTLPTDFLTDPTLN